MKYIKDISLDFNAESDSITASAKQLDFNSRYLKITPLLDGNTIDLNGIRTVFSAERPDGQIICSLAETDSDGKIIISLNAAVLSVEGIVRCEIKLYEGDSLFSSCPFYLNVVGSIGDGEIKDSEQYTELTLLIKECRELMKRVSVDEEIVYKSAVKAVILELQEKEYQEAEA